MNTTMHVHLRGMTLQLDADWICRRVACRSADESTRAFADRCVGAQCVGSHDRRSGEVTSRPRVGASMLLAVVDADGRIALLRTAPILSLVACVPAPASQPRSALPDETPTLDDVRRVLGAPTRAGAMLPSIFSETFPD